MMYPAISVFATNIIVITQPTSSGSGFDFTTLLPLAGVLIGAFVSATTSFFLNNRSNKQQLMRDEAEYKRQIEREQIAYDRQLEREQVAYVRSLKVAKRERLRGAYKVILNAADNYQYETEQLNHISSHGNISSTGVDEAITEITLEDVGADVMKIFFDMRGAFNDFSVNMSMHMSSGEEILMSKEAVIQKRKELTEAIQKHLKELES